MSPFLFLFYFFLKICCVSVCVCAFFKKDKHQFLFGKHEIDISAVSQLVERGQTNAILRCLVYLQQHYMSEQTLTISQLIHKINQILNQKGLDILTDVGMYSNV